MSAVPKADLRGRWLTDPGGEAFTQWAERTGFPASHERGFYCDICDDYFGTVGAGYRIWHCPVCLAHQPHYRDECNNCRRGERPA